MLQCLKAAYNGGWPADRLAARMQLWLTAASGLQYLSGG